VTRVLIADDHPAFRAGLGLLLADVEDISLVGEADTGARAVELAQELAPDVVVMDLRMPDLDGIEATRRIGAVAPSAAVIVLTMFEDDDSVFAAMRAAPWATCSRALSRTRSSVPSVRSPPARRSSAPRSLAG